MRRVLSLTFAMLTMTAYGIAPANAQLETDELRPAIAEAPAASTDAAKTDTPAADVKPVGGKTAQADGSKSAACITSNAAVRAASTVVGTVVGTPVSIVRHSIQEINAGTRDLIGDTNNKYLYALGLPLGVPFGIISGVLQGPPWAFVNAYKGSKDEPFSADTFSLGELK